MKKMNKAGRGFASPEGLIVGLVFLIILFATMEVMIPEANTSLNNLATNNTGVPFIQFFEQNGLIMLIVMATLLLGTIAVIGLRKVGGRK